MTQLLTARRRAAEFACAVDNGGEHLDPSLDAPLRLVQVLRAAPPVNINDRFRTELRIQLLAAAHHELGERDVGPATRSGVVTTAPVHQRRLAAAASALVLVGGTTGVAAASQQALPGDVLYPVKRMVESAELQLASSAFAHGSELLEQATTRLDEVGGLVARGPNDPGQPVEIDAALTDFTGSAADGGHELLAVYRSDADPNAIGTVREFTTAAAASLTELAPSIPPTATDALTDAAATVESLDATARALCPSCAGTIPPVTMPTTLMALSFASPVSQPVSGGPAEPDQGHQPQPGPQSDEHGDGRPGENSQPSARPKTAPPSVAPPQVQPSAGPGQPTAGAPNGGGSGVPNVGPALPTAGGPVDGSSIPTPDGSGGPNVGSGVPTVEDPGVPNVGPGVPPDEDPGVPTVGPAPTVESPGVPTVGPEVPTVESPGTPTVDPVVPTTDPGVPTTDPVVPTTDPIVPTTDPVVPTTDPVVPNVAPTVPTVPTVSTPTGGLGGGITDLPEETTLPSTLNNPLGSAAPTASATSGGGIGAVLPSAGSVAPSDPLPGSREDDEATDDGQSLPVPTPGVP